MSFEKSIMKYAACLLLAGMAVGTGFAQDKDACGKVITESAKVQRAIDMWDISNVASSHEYYHGAFLHKREIEEIFSKRDDISWKNNNDYYKNRKSVWNFYAEGIKQANPLGALWYHMLTTPIIQVAADGQTAKAIWMSFGNVSGATGEGKAMSQWTEEKYGMDFIKEDGKWKIWHLRTYVEYYSPFDKSWTVSNLAAPKGSSNAMNISVGPMNEDDKDKDKAKGPSATVKEEPGAKFNADMMKPDENGDYYIGYSPERKTPIMDPVPPAAYCHFDEATKY